VNGYVSFFVAHKTTVAFCMPCFDIHFDDASFTFKKEDIVRMTKSVFNKVV